MTEVSTCVHFFSTPGTCGVPSHLKHTWPQFRPGAFPTTLTALPAVPFSAGHLWEEPKSPEAPASLFLLASHSPVPVLSTFPCCFHTFIPSLALGQDLISPLDSCSSLLPPILPHSILDMDTKELSNN